MVNDKIGCHMTGLAKAVLVSFLLAMGTPAASVAGQPATLEDFLTPEEQFSNGLDYLLGKDVSKDEVKAARLFRKAADSGLADAQYHLGLMYALGQGVSRDHAEAIRWFRKAADQGHMNAQTNLGNMYQTGLGAPQNHAEAARWYRKAADQGKPEAQGYLGSMYIDGLGVPQDFVVAAQWFRKAAEQGLPAAQSVLGNLYRVGAGVPKDPVEAVRWYRMAAEQGEVEAQFFMGLMSTIGQGTPQDWSEAAKWYQKSAEQGYAQAQYQLGVIYRNGFGVAEDHVLAVNLYRKAAAQGHVEAQHNLGLMFWNGFGVTKDRAEAIGWVRKAADQGFPDAQYFLGTNYREGDGVPKSLTEAARLYRKAADQGYRPAQFQMALLTRFGQGVPKDLVSAYVWSILSVAGTKLGDPDYDLAHKFRNDTAQVLTPQQIAKAETLAKQWKPKGQTPDSPSASPSKATTQQAKSTQKSLPGEPPAVSLQPIPATTDQTINVTGKVTSKGRITGLLIDGTDASVRGDGSFSVRRGIPLGESEIRLAATDEWGQTGEARLRVTRVAASTETDLAPLSPTRLRGKPRPNAIALIIGVEQYKSIPPAEFAENDARSFYDYAINALGIPASRVKLLTGVNAQRVDVDAAILTWLKPQVIKGQSEVFVFFSGHGLASEDGKDLYLLPQDGNRALLDRSALRRNELIDMIADSGAKATTLFLDTCYSGGTRGKESLVASARPVLIAAKDHPVPANVTILAAAANDQLSSSLAPARHGLFSYFLMKGLEGEAAGGGRSITAAKLRDYLADRIPPEAAKMGRTQTPQLVGDPSKVISIW